ncbi:MAG TPA: ATP-dependent sacrificial sulfur transferase LarE [Polyangiaceae bacterium]|nr:ATP-dependent sacrificial sulfur transferase LarE [Polyangiaceae bacterium]
MTLPQPSRNQLEELRRYVLSLESVLVCFSGGIDSALLLAVATEQLPRGRAIGMTAVSPSLAPAEREDAERLARELNADLRLVESHELDLPDYAKNEADRCFHCKTELYHIAEQKRREWGIAYILNGTNQDDLGDYRPGIEAARRAEVRMPFVELGFTKADIRAAAKELNLPIWDKPASACLSSRLPYGTTVTRERLEQIASMEAGLRALGFRQVRVRWHERIARIEVSVAELSRTVDPSIRAQIVELGKTSGFNYVTVDLAGYRTGSHNEVLLGSHLKLVD